jgi:hemerythrin-like metal-binding protein
MPNRSEWKESFRLNHAELDTQHQHLLVQCNALGDCLEQGSEESHSRFRTLLDALLAQAHEHLDAEIRMLEAIASPRLEEHRDERDEFAYMVQEIITPDYFDMEEIQSFLTLWWTGHIVAATTTVWPSSNAAP